MKSETSFPISLLVLPFIDGFCGHRPNGNICDVCQMKTLSRRLTRVLNYEENLSDRAFLEHALQYLLKTLEIKVYYHLGEHIQYDLLPRLLRRLGKCILDPKCDHQILLKYHPLLMQHYTASLKTLIIIPFFSSNNCQ